METPRTIARGVADPQRPVLTVFYHPTIGGRVGWLRRNTICNHPRRFGLWHTYSKARRDFCLPECIHSLNRYFRSCTRVASEHRALPPHLLSPPKSIEDVLRGCLPADPLRKERFFGDQRRLIPWIRYEALSGGRGPGQLFLRYRFSPWEGSGKSPCCKRSPSSREGGTMSVRLPSVAVIAPAYNHSAYVEASLASVCQQDYQGSLSVYFIDDASSDDTYERGSALLEGPLGTRLSDAWTWRNSENIGAHASYNLALTKTRSDLILFLNTDDAYAENRVSAAVRAYQKSKEPDEFWGFSPVRLVDDQDNPTAQDPFLIYAGEFLSYCSSAFPSRSMALLLTNHVVSTGNLCTSRLFLQKVGDFYPFRMVHDYDYVLRSCLQAEPNFLAETRYIYRLHQRNTFRTLRRLGHLETAQVLSYHFLEGALRRPRNKHCFSRFNYPASYLDAFLDRVPWVKSIYRHALAPEHREDDMCGASSWGGHVHSTPPNPTLE